MFDVALMHLSGAISTAMVNVTPPERESTTPLGTTEMSGLRSLPDKNRVENAPAWYTLSATEATRNVASEIVFAAILSVATAVPSLRATVIAAAEFEGTVWVLDTALDAQFGVAGQDAAA